MRLEEARPSGTPIVVNPLDRDLPAASAEVTEGMGGDLGLDATRSTTTLPLLLDLAALSGEVSIGGSIPGMAEISLFNPLQTKELTLIRAWQPRSPVTGHASFPGTQRRNRRSFPDPVTDGRVQVEHLIMHRLAPQDAARRRHDPRRR
jgi:threonine dehydrogenase-like Zn-dependent dehydrogenase